MSVKIIIIGDTHLNSFKKLPKEMAQAIKEGDWIIHAGDYTSIDTVEGLIRWKGDKFKGVFGNADPLSIRKILPDKVILEIKGKKIGITHPFCGGPETFIKAIKESEKGKLCVMLLPVSTSTQLFHRHILPNKKEIRFIEKRIKFCGVNTKGEFVTGKVGMHDSMLVVFDGRTL